MSVCVCVREREREKRGVLGNEERERERWGIHSKWVFGSTINRQHHHSNERFLIRQNETSQWGVSDDAELCRYLLPPSPCSSSK